MSGLLSKKLIENKKHFLEIAKQEYDEKLTQETNKLYNYLIAYLANTKIPIINVILVLELLLDEAKNISRTQYLGEK